MHKYATCFGYLPYAPWLCGLYSPIVAKFGLTSIFNFLFLSAKAIILESKNTLMVSSVYVYFLYTYTLLILHVFDFRWITIESLLYNGKIMLVQKIGGS